MTSTVALYCRISVDRQGRREGVDAQEKWGRIYAAQTWPGAPVKVFTDNHLSAAKDDHRPGYEALRDAIRRGEIGHVWSVEQSRLERREIEWFVLASEMDTAGITELHTNRDGIVRVRDEVAGIKAVLSAGEARKLKQRVNDRLAELAAQGRPAGGAFFGYRRITRRDGVKTLEIDQREADAIRWAADAILSGWSLTNVAAELQARGHRGALGGRLGTSAVRSALRAPAVAGLRVHKGEVIGRGNWEPILDEATWQAVRAKLDKPRTITTANGKASPVTPVMLSQRVTRKYLLTGGLARCGVCGAGLVGLVKHFKRASGTYRKRPYLMCSRTNGGNACVGIMLDSTEEYVTDRLFAELDKPDFLDAVFDDDSAERRDAITRELSGLNDQRTELARIWAQGAFGTTEWAVAKETLDEREQALKTELGALPLPTSRPDIGAVREAWLLMTLDERRELIRLFVAKVTIGKGKRGARTFDPGRVDIDWRLH